MNVLMGWNSIYELLTKSFKYKRVLYTFVINYVK